MLKTNWILTVMVAACICFTACNKDKEEKDNTQPGSEEETENCLVNRIDLTDEDADTIVSVIFQYNSQNQLEFTRELNTQTGQVSFYYKYLRNAAGKINKVEFYNDSHVMVAFSEHDFNSQDQMIETRWYDFSNGNLRLDDKFTYEYNSAGQINKVTEFSAFNANPQPLTYFTLNYDAAGNPVETKFYEIGTGGAADSLVARTVNTFDNQYNPWKQLYLPEIWYTPREIFLITSPHVINNITFTGITDPSLNGSIYYINSFSADGKLQKQEVTDSFGSGRNTYHFKYQCQ